MRNKVLFVYVSLIYLPYCMPVLYTPHPPAITPKHTRTEACMHISSLAHTERAVAQEEEQLPCEREASSSMPGSPRVIAEVSLSKTTPNCSQMSRLAHCMHGSLCQQCTNVGVNG